MFFGVKHGNSFYSCHLAVSEENRIYSRKIVSSITFNISLTDEISVNQIKLRQIRRVFMRLVMNWRTSGECSWDGNILNRVLYKLFYKLDDKLRHMNIFFSYEPARREFEMIYFHASTNLRTSTK